MSTLSGASLSADNAHPVWHSFHEAAVCALYAGMSQEARRIFACIGSQGESGSSLLRISERVRLIRGMDSQVETTLPDNRPCPYHAVRTSRGRVPVPQNILDEALKRQTGLYGVCFAADQVEGCVDNLVDWTTRLAVDGDLLGLYALNPAADGPRGFAVFTTGRKIALAGGSFLQSLDGLPVSVKPEELIPPGKARLIRHRRYALVHQLPTIRPAAATGSGQKGNARQPAKAGPEGLLQAKVRFPIGIKLGMVVSALLAVSLVTMNLLASAFFLRDATVRVEENNYTIAQISAIKIEDDIRSITDRARLLLEISEGDAASPSVERFYGLNPDILAVALDDVFTTYNNASLSALGIEAAALAGNPAVPALETLEIFNATASLGAPAIGLRIPFRSAGLNGILTAYASAERYAEVLGNRGIVETWVLDSAGRLLLHADQAMVQAAPDFSANPAVIAMRDSPLGNGQLRYRDQAGQEYLAAFRRIAYGNIGVIANAPASKAFEAVGAIQRRNLLILGAILSLAALLTYFFSRTISDPVQMLMDAAILVERGHFDLDIQATTRDELGALSSSFVKMGHGLAEREKIKDAFGRFVNKSVAEMATKGEIKLGGERKQATIFFSDIRSFTAISESMQPEQVVEFLNQYLTRMVGCVSRGGGVVDKYIGDAIMAVWGVPVSTGDDPTAAVDASLAMRASLMEFNRNRGTADKPIIRIGCGMNTGPVVAGQIGSNERMEYTVIGDTVNLASRIESLNKAFGTDILVSEYTMAQLGDRYRSAIMPMIAVKGKAEPLHVHAILGRAEDPAAPRTLTELRRLLGIADTPLDAGHIVADNEEQKFTILGDAKARAVP